MNQTSNGNPGGWDQERAAAQFDRSYSQEEEIARTQVHYDHPPEFLNSITGGEWNVYSANIWEGANNDTESQVTKLDLMARLMDLQPGQRVLEVGCGQAGPLVYMAKHRGVTGVGLDITPMQKEYAERRVREQGADVSIHLSHWRDFEDEEGFDAVYTDEVIVHFNDLSGYFDKVKRLLKPGGRMVNKELHFAGSQSRQITRGSAFINEIYGETGNYRTLHEELALVDQAGFTLETHQQIPMSNYRQTIRAWLSNMRQNRQELEGLVGADHYHRFRTYLMICGRMFAGTSMTVDVVASRSPV